MNINSQILDLINKRLIKGERKYGHENVINDGRDFIREALEESLDCAVYLAARLVEIQNKKEKQMGRAINMENSLQKLEARVKLVEDALEELLQFNEGLTGVISDEKVTRVHHVDLIEDVKPAISLSSDGVEVAPDEEFRAPVVVKKKRKKALEKRIKATT